MTHCMCCWVKRSHSIVSSKMRESSVSCRVRHNWCWVGSNDWGMRGVMRCDYSVRGSVRGQHCGMMNCMMGSNSCMMCCMMRSHSMSQLSMSSVTGLDDLRWRPHLSRWFAPGVRATCSLLGSDDLRGERSAIADPVTVSELSIFPLRERPTESKL